MKNKLIMTPGPTEVRENVRLARAKETTNPDIDIDFFDFYKETCENIAKIMQTKNAVRILSGEGILGLEAACASLTEKNDRVLVIDNGIFGEGFADFVKIYGGEVVFFKGDRERKIDVNELEKFLSKDNDFKYATVVHCDTPSGVLNEIDRICPLLKKYGILTVVDSVAAFGGEEVKVDEWKIDILLGGSQKVVSAPPGLTFLSISEDVFKAMERRKEPIASFYCNLNIWKSYYEDKWFPYTMPISDIYGLNQAVENILEEGIYNVINRHKRNAEKVRKAFTKCGMELNLKDGFSNTVTVVKVPMGLNLNQFLNVLKEDYNLMIGSSFGYLSGKVFRIGHMGENCVDENIIYTLLAIENSLQKLGYELNGKLSQEFIALSNVEEL